MRGFTKTHVTVGMGKMSGCCPFYVQHALILLTSLARTVKGEEMEILDVDTWCVGSDGAEPLLNLMLEEQLGFAL